MNKSLRELAQEYAKNALDKDDYRQLRGELIRGICAYEIEVQENDYTEPEENTWFNTITGVFYPKAGDSLSAYNRHWLLSGKGLVIVVTIIVTLAIGLTILFKAN